MSSIAAMPAWMGSVFLCAAVFAALALGVLIAYAVCMGVFEAMQRHAGLVREKKATTAAVVVVEG
jgi:hypothetical protein